MNAFMKFTETVMPLVKAVASAFFWITALFLVVRIAWDASGAVVQLLRGMLQ